MTAIYHITHLDNLNGILGAQRLWSDAQRIRQGFPCTGIGHANIKERRLNRPVPVAARGRLGEYVPFYFCNRSVMLYVIFRNGVVGYSGGQAPIVHLVSSVEAATASGRPWAFTDRHAELAYARYFDNLAYLDQVDWRVMPLTYWADSSETRERRQAEFLVYDWFPWHCVERIGVYNAAAVQRVEQILQSCTHRPAVEVQKSWYY